MPNGQKPNPHAEAGLTSWPRSKTNAGGSDDDDENDHDRSDAHESRNGDCVSGTDACDEHGDERRKHAKRRRCHPKKARENGENDDQT